MSVARVEQLDLIARLNELERIAPIYLAALERIATAESGRAQRVALDAIRDAEARPAQ